jgi:hypothetical protein
LIDQPFNSIFSVEGEKVIKEERLQFIGESDSEDEDEKIQIIKDNRDLKQNELFT